MKLKPEPTEFSDSILRIDGSAGGGALDCKLEEVEEFRGTFLASYVKRVGVEFFSYTKVATQEPDSVWGNDGVLVKFGSGAHPDLEGALHASKQRARRWVRWLDRDSQSGSLTHWDSAAFDEPSKLR